ncbi:MAG: urease accessory protein UreE [Leptolyngbyaceae cyanobacterium CRU_2_3]|nr:urease accessory protein UreE [Leptolyngbyaceae cyanobacterium CRU_2_3]
MLNLTHRLPANANRAVNFTLNLTAEERSRSHHHFQAEGGQGLHLQLPRGTVLYHGDLLATTDQEAIVQIAAKPEPVITVVASSAILLLRAAYHLGNRHVPLEVTIDYLRLSPDPVLKSMLEQMGLHVIEETLPFQPEVGAYHSHRQAYSEHSQIPAPAPLGRVD